MSLFQALGFSRLGYETELLIPFKNISDLGSFLDKHKIRDLNELKKFNGNFLISPVFEGGNNFRPCDVLVYQSYVEEDWDKFLPICKANARLITKSFPKFVPSPASVLTREIMREFELFDVVACSLREDVDILGSVPDFTAQYPNSVVYSPRGASPTLLHPGFKASIPPTIGFDVPNCESMAAIEHYFEPIERLRFDFPDLRIYSIGRDTGIKGATMIPFGRFDEIYDRFFNQIHVYCSINYEHSPQHLQAAVQKRNPDWRHRGIYEVQNVECQMSGAVLIGHRKNLIDELYQPGRTGLNFADYRNADEIYRMLKYAIEHRHRLGAAARQFAMDNFDWRTCINLWSEGIQRKLATL